ncbi:MAG: universal stress protein [Hydrogenophilales bacterium]|nr:universal stress protein [Hydrogenophilales bacterium]
MVEKLLVVFDGSESAQAAFDFALDLAGTYGAELFVLAAARPPEFGEEVETEAVIEQSRRHHERVLQPLKSLARDRKARFEVKVGHPAEAIVLYAEDPGIDHIVVGHRGHGLFELWLIGSVAHQVIAYAPCAVTVVRPRA